MKNSNFRFLGRFICQADTPLFVGSGESSLTKDSLVVKDVNDLPFIPGTSLSGVLRNLIVQSKLMDAQTISAVFGSKENSTSSRLKISSAYFMVSNDHCSEIVEQNNSLIDNAKLVLSDLPKRQHVRLNEKGVSDNANHGLFDNEIVFKGARFIFELELEGDESDEEIWNCVLGVLQSGVLRVGGGTRNGWGRLKLLRKSTAVFNLNNQSDLENYLELNPSLNSIVQWQDFNDESVGLSSLTSYKLSLRAESFTFFSAGFGDDEVDNIPVSEHILQYSTNGIKLSEQSYHLIPATSVKGAISSRVNFHYNRLRGCFIDINANINKPILKAQHELFGSSASDENPSAGNIFLNDIFVQPVETSSTEVFNHVAIDRFTGGGIHGALFSEKVSNLQSANIDIDIQLVNRNYSDDVISAFEKTLEDICTGLLPLGGGVTKGFGQFVGNCYKNGLLMFEYSK